MLQAPLQLQAYQAFHKPSLNPKHKSLQRHKGSPSPAWFCRKTRNFMSCRVRSKSMEVQLLLPLASFGIVSEADNLAPCTVVACPLAKLVSVKGCSSTQPQHIQSRLSDSQQYVCLRAQQLQQSRCPRSYRSGSQSAESYPACSRFGIQHSHSKWRGYAPRRPCPVVMVCADGQATGRVKCMFAIRSALFQDRGGRDRVVISFCISHSARSCASCIWSIK